MQATINVDTREFQRVLKEYAKTTKKTGAEIINQRALNIAGRAFDEIPPASGTGVDAKRERVRHYLREQVSTRVKVATSGKRKGRFIKRGARSKQLQRIHLIVNKSRARIGKKGLWGKDMLRYSGEAVRRNQVAVGYLKSLFLPIITTLNAVCKFKFPHRKTRNISRWPGSAANGGVKIATPADPTAVMRASAKTGRFDKAAQAVITTAMQSAINAEAAELRRHMAEKLQKEADKINAR